MKCSHCSTFFTSVLFAATLLPHAAWALTSDSTPAESPAPAAESVSESVSTTNALLPDAPSALPAAALPDAPAPSTQIAVEGAYPVQRETTWRSIFPDFLHDEKVIWTSPAQLAHGRGWVPLLATAGITGGLIVADPHVMPWFRDRQNQLNGFNTVFSEWNTMGMIAAVPVGMMITGTVQGDQYEKSTALLAARGYANTEVLEFAAKLVARRERPSDVPAGENFNHTFFKSKLVSGNGSSFPSGHSAGAFCVAYVVSTRYRNHKWVPYAMYSLATVISMSRITTLGHFPSDVFLGGAMGYAVSRFEVMRPR